ncbi:MAG: ribosomal RNA small subunit methyltransferase A [Candidatus Pacebacteria bacterium]|nr:ribosomal RNA small subunit methyltransferase A [Candidatus Paceibacterota bacterium]
MHKKKSLGQHFLNNKDLLGAVVDAAIITKGEMVVEIGPGEGTLTAVLLERGAKVVALEKDTRLIELLKNKFVGKKLEVIEGDALDFDPTTYKLKPGAYKVVGNVPYYITGALFKKFLTTKHQPDTLVFLVQKEVAERIARSKKESILSLSVKAYGIPKYIKTVPAGAFVPPPKVDSAILLVSDISRKNFKNNAHEEKFFELVKKAFSSKRKMLRSTLGIDSDKRPEDLTLEEWLELAKH